jgi:hypothetical protein
MPVNMSSLLLLDEKEKLIVLGRRAELFCSAQKNYKKKYMRNQGENYFAKKIEHKFAAISGCKHQASLYSVTVTRRDHRDLTLREIF